jgi:hypothetical protein
MKKSYNAFFSALCTVKDINFLALGRWSSAFLALRTSLKAEFQLFGNSELTDTKMHKLNILKNGIQHFSSVKQMQMTEISKR